jgi:hypothetical protein
MSEDMEKDLLNVRTQIANIQQELSKVQLMQTNLARLQGVESYLAGKLEPVEEEVEEPEKEEAAK